MMEDKEAKQELVKQQREFMDMHRNADSFSWNAQQQLTSVTYLSPLQKADYMEYPSFRLAQQQREEQRENEYSQWSIEKFCRLTERYRESSHMAGTHDAYLVYKAELDRIEEAFKRLHPRAYRNFLQRFYEANH